MCHAVQDHSHFTLPGLYRVISVSPQQHHPSLTPSCEMQGISPERSSRSLDLSSGSIAGPCPLLQKHADARRT